MSPSGEHHDIVERAALKRPPDRFSPQKGLSVPAVCRRNGGHSREQPRCHGIHLIFAPQLVEKQHIGGQTPHRLRDSHGLRTIQQDVAAPQRGLSLSLIHIFPFEQGFHVPIELGDGDDPRRFGFPDILHSRLPGIVRFYVTAIYPFRPDLTAASSAIPAALSAE